MQKVISIRSELLKNLFQSFLDDNSDSFFDVANEIINNEEKKKHHLLANDLKKIIKSKKQTQFQLNNNFTEKYKTNIPIPRDAEKGFPLLEINENYYNLDDVILNDELKTKLEYVIEEFNQMEILATYGLNPKQKLLFCGPPGTGKTLTSHVISSVLGYPLVHIRFDSIVSSFLGETATNLRKIFDFIEQGEWVVLFDEFDALGKERDDGSEHGELRRVVNAVLQMMDSYDGKSIIIAATNHEQILDSAIWRRFDEIIEFPVLGKNQLQGLLQLKLRGVRREFDLDSDELHNIFNGKSPAIIERIIRRAVKRMILKQKEFLTIRMLKHAFELESRIS